MYVQVSHSWAEVTYCTVSTCPQARFKSKLNLSGKPTTWFGPEIGKKLGYALKSCRGKRDFQVANKTNRSLYPDFLRIEGYYWLFHVLYNTKPSHPCYTLPCGSCICKLPRINSQNGVRVSQGNCKSAQKSISGKCRQTLGQSLCWPTPLKSEQQQIIQPYILRASLLKNLSQMGTKKQTRDILIKKKLEKFI